MCPLFVTYWCFIIVFTVVLEDLLQNLNLFAASRI